MSSLESSLIRCSLFGIKGNQRTLLWFLTPPYMFPFILYQNLTACGMETMIIYSVYITVCYIYESEGLTFPFFQILMACEHENNGVRAWKYLYVKAVAPPICLSGWRRGNNPLGGSCPGGVIIHLEPCRDYLSRKTLQQGVCSWCTLVCVCSLSCTVPLKAKVQTPPQL